MINVSHFSTLVYYSDGSNHTKVSRQDSGVSVSTQLKEKLPIKTVNNQGPVVQNVTVKTSTGKYQLHKQINCYFFV